MQGERRGRLGHAVAAEGKAGHAIAAGDGGIVAVPKGEGDKLKTTIQRTDPLVAPLAQGQRVGTLEVSTAGGAKLASLPLVVLQPVPEAGLLGRAWDALRLWIK